MKLRIIIVLILSHAVAALISASFVVLEFLEPSLYYSWKQERMVEPGRWGGVLAPALRSFPNF